MLRTIKVSASVEQSMYLISNLKKLKSTKQNNQLYTQNIFSDFIRLIITMRNWNWLFSYNWFHLVRFLLKTRFFQSMLTYSCKRYTKHQSLAESQTIKHIKEMFFKDLMQYHRTSIAAPTAKKQSHTYNNVLADGFIKWYLVFNNNMLGLCED